MKSPHNVILSTLICILFSVALTSCSKNLTRSEAQSQLEASYKTEGVYTYIDTGDMLSGSYVTITSGQLRKSCPDVAMLSDAGLLKVTVAASGVRRETVWGDQVEDHIVITLTEKAKPFLGETLSIYSMNGRANYSRFKLLAATPTIQILGITEPAEGFGRKMSSVAFQVSWKNTQVGDALNKSYSVEKRQATFVKYDNGWRLEK